MALIDISGPITNGMWHYGEPYLDLPIPPVRIEEVEFPEPLKGSIFTQTISMCVQTATYLETAAHVYGGRETIETVTLDRTWMVPTVVIHTPAPGRHKVTLEEARRDLDSQGVEISPGDAVLIHTGWDAAWSEPIRYLDDFPYISRELWFWLMDQHPSIMGCDTARADSPRDLQNFFGDFFKTDILLLAPVVNLGLVTRALPKPRLVALPLKIAGACASPVRAVLVMD